MYKWMIQYIIGCVQKATPLENMRVYHVESFDYQLTSLIKTYLPIPIYRGFR